MSAGISLKAGIYFSHYECLGHTSRVIAIAEVFKKRFPNGNLFFIQAGVPQPLANLSSWGKVYELPEKIVDRSIFRGGLAQLAGWAPARAKACGSIIDQESPDVLITEFFPLGREESRHELMPALVKAAARGTQLWAVAGYPLLTGSGGGWRQKICALYHKIIILSPSMEKDQIEDSLPEGNEKEQYKEFFKTNARKIEFAGYILAKAKTLDLATREGSTKIDLAHDVCRVAVVRGGGAYYPKIIAEAIRASELLGQGYHFTIVAGPSTTEQEWQLFASLNVQKKVNNVSLFKAVDHYEELIRDSNVCVTTGSYHSAVMLMKYQKKAVIIPFSGYEKGTTFSEQPARAGMLKDLLGTNILGIQELTALRLSEAIKEVHQQPQVLRDLPKDWFCGADVLGNIFSGLVRR